MAMPAPVPARSGLGPGPVLVVLAQGRPDTDQTWFWTPEWLGGELEAEQDIALGRASAHDSDEAFLASLEARLKPE